MKHLPIYFYLAASLCAGAASAEKSNVLFILTEDQGPHLSYVGTPGIETPNMDTLANSGVYFNAAHDPNKVKLPAFLPDTPIVELYETAADPDGMKNLAGDPAYQAEFDRLYAALRQWSKDIGDTAMKYDSQLSL
jgi:arylsulfatase A-like enzyme